MNDNRFPLTGETVFEDLSAWMKERDVLWNAVGPTERHDNGLFGTGLGAWGKIFSPMFIVFGRPGEAAVIATKGNILVWDGQKITVEIPTEG